MKQINVCMVTGGTGGHIYPALSVADALKAENIPVTFIGNRGNMEATIIPASGYVFYGIKNKGYTGTISKKIIALFGQIIAIINALFLLMIIRPTIVIAFGGYVSVPVGIASKILRIPLLLHEQNAIAGLANKILGRLANGVALSYKQTEKQFQKKKTRFIGNPRASLFKRYQKEEVLRSLGLDPLKRTVLIIMGSLGSETINQLLKESIPLAAQTAHQYILVTGKKHYEAFVDGMSVHENVVVLDHINQIMTLSALDCIVCRSGATTVAEVIAANLPAIFIPSPYVVKNHQYENIKPLLEQHAALMLAEATLTSESLIKAIESLLSNQQQLDHMKQQLKQFETPHALDNLMSWIKEFH